MQLKNICNKFEIKDQHSLDLKKNPLGLTQPHYFFWHFLIEVIAIINNIYWVL